MTSAFEAVWETSEDKKITLRQAAGVVAVKRIAEAMQDKI